MEDAKFIRQNNGWQEMNVSAGESTLTLNL